MVGTLGGVLEVEGILRGDGGGHETCAGGLWVCVVH